MSSKSLALARAKLQLMDADKEQPKSNEKKLKHTQDFLWQAIESASNCMSIMPLEEQKILAQIETITNDPEEEHKETRINYQLHNINIMKETYPFFAEEAKRRRDLILDVNKRNKWGQEKEKCKEDTLYWFNNYAWTADPRKSGLWALPFNPYDYQQDTIKWIENLAFVAQESGVIEKSRDLGLSWLITSLFYKHWQHAKDGEFSALIGSMSADDCDKIGDKASLFEKIRIQSKLQPLGLLPKGFDPLTIPYMKIVNPENSSAIVGQTANPDFGRGGRFKIILMDELAAFEADTAALAACSQSSPCKIYNSTARGIGNEFHRLAHSGTIKKKTLRWQQHPNKTQDWYEYQKLELNPVQIAQELDIDYNASQPNKVYSYDEVNLVATKSEVMNVLPQFRGSDGKFEIPFGSKIIMGYDVGQSDNHVNALLWFVTLREGTVTKDGINLSGSVFCYREIIAPSRTTPRNIARIIEEAETKLMDGKRYEYEKRMVMDRVISHEQTTMRDALDWDYGVDFRKWTPDYNNGIARVKDYIQITKLHEIHPFREPIRRERFPDAPPIMGRPKLFLIVEDGQGELIFDRSNSKYRVKPAENSEGLVRLRSEFPSYHYPTAELGKEMRKMRPKKLFDDAMDCLRCCASECFTPIGGLTEEEKLENYLPVTFKTANIQKIPDKDKGMAWLMREQEKREFAKQQQLSQLSYRDKMWLKATKT